MLIGWRSAGLLKFERNTPSLTSQERANNGLVPYLLCRRRCRDLSGTARKNGLERIVNLLPGDGFHDFARPKVARIRGSTAHSRADRPAHHETKPRPRNRANGLLEAASLRGQKV